MRSRSLLSQYSFRSYRVCPDCQSKYTTDVRTKKRGLIAVVFALITMALSFAGTRIGFPWGLAAFLSGTGSLIYVGYTLSKLEYVKYHD